MTRPEKNCDDAFLDALFTEERSARDAETAVSPDFMARVLADAHYVQEGFDTQTLSDRVKPQRPGFFAQIGAALGGWPAFAGLATASVCGLWLGISPPDGLSDTASLYLGGSEELLDPMSGFDFAIGEG